MLVRNRSWPHVNSQQPEPQVLLLKARPFQDLAQGAVGLGEGAACEQCGAEVCRGAIAYCPLAVLQGFLAHKKQPPHLGPPYSPRHSPSVGSRGGSVSYEQGTPVDRDSELRGEAAPLPGFGAGSSRAWGRGCMRGVWRGGVCGLSTRIRPRCFGARQNRSRAQSLSPKP